MIFVSFLENLNWILYLEISPLCGTRSNLGFLPICLPFFHPLPCMDSFYNLSVNKKQTSFDPLPPHLVHIVIRCLLWGIRYIKRLLFIHLKAALELQTFHAQVQCIFQNFSCVLVPIIMQTLSIEKCWLVSLYYWPICICLIYYIAQLIPPFGSAFWGFFDWPQTVLCVTNFSAVQSGYKWFLNGHSCFHLSFFFGQTFKLQYEGLQIDYISCENSGS